MITDHRAQLHETTFAHDYPLWQPRPSIWPRILHFVASALAVAAFFGLVVWMVSKTIG